MYLSFYISCILYWIHTMKMKWFKYADCVKWIIQTNLIKNYFNINIASLMQNKHASDVNFPNDILPDLNF